MDFSKTTSKWIWYDESESVNQYVAFRQEIDTAYTKAEIFISCDTNYMLWVNGEFIDSGIFLARACDKYYDKVSLNLRKGKNIICILVYYQGVGSQSYSRGKAGLIYGIKSSKIWIDNTSAVCGHVSGFIEGEIAQVSYQVGPSFSYDARLEKDWKNERIPSNCIMKKVQILDFSETHPKEIKQRPVKKLDLLKKTEFNVIARGNFIYENEDEVTAVRMQNSYIKSKYVNIKNNDVEIEANKNSFLLIDMGKESSGYFEMDITAPEGLQIDVAYGEHLEDLRVRSRIHQRNFAFTIHTKEGRQSFTNHYRRIAGRYIQIHFVNPGKEVVLHYAGINIAEYPMARKKPLKIDDKLHQMIYDICINTLNNCMHEHYEDCPWREQALYGFDSRNQGLAGYSEFKNPEFIKASLMLMDSSMGKDFYQDMCVPSDAEIKIPGFTLMWMVFACEYTEYYKDVKAGIYFYDRITKMLSAYWENAENGIIPVPQGGVYWNFYDWADGMDGIRDNAFIGEDEVTRLSAMYNLYYIYALNKTISMAKMLKMPTASLKERAKMLKKAINKNFYSDKTGLYKSFVKGEEHYSELVQSMAILSGVAVNEKHLTQEILSGKMTKVTLSTSVFKYDALLKNKANQKYVLDEIAQIWGGMLRCGATTFYETAKGAADFENAGSLCHGWAAIPIYVYRKILEG